MDMSGIATEIDKLKCQFCELETPSQYNFCVECDMQIKCLGCGTNTYPGKDYCLNCGQSLIAKASNSPAPNRFVRTVEQDGDKYKEHTELAVTDEAVHEFAPFVVGQTFSGRKVKASSSKQIPGNTEDTFYEEVPDGISGEADDNSNDSGDQEPLKPKTSSTSALSKYFIRDGDILVATITDFKGKNWAEQQRNFLILYTKAFKEITGRIVSDPKHYKAAADKINLVDPNNFPNILTKLTKAKFTSLTGGFDLNADGEKDFQRIINLLENDTEKGYAYASRIATTNVKRHKLSREDKLKFESWTSENVDLGKLDIRDVTTGRDAALVALWIITLHLKKGDAFMWNEAMHYFLKKYSTVSVTSKAAAKAVNSKDNEKFFQRNTEGEFYLSPAAQKLVEGWISGTQIIKKEEAK